MKVEQAANNLATDVVEIAKGATEKAEEAVSVVSSPEAEEAAKAAAEEVKRVAAEAAAEVKAREDEALEKAKTVTVTFLWPWQKTKPEAPVVSSSSTSELPRTNRPLSPYTR